MFQVCNDDNHLKGTYSSFDERKHIIFIFFIPKFTKHVWSFMIVSVVPVHLEISLKTILTNVEAKQRVSIFILKKIKKMNYCLSSLHKAIAFISLLFLLPFPRYSIYAMCSLLGTFIFSFAILAISRVFNPKTHFNPIKTWCSMWIMRGTIDTFWLKLTYIQLA